MSWLCLFCGQISSPNGCGHFEENRRLLTVQNHPFCSGAPRSPNRYLHQLLLPSNIVILELSSAIKYFRTDFSIFTLNANKVTILFRLAAKPILGLFLTGKNPHQYMNFRNERTFKVAAIVYRPKIWFYFFGHLKNDVSRKLSCCTT